MEREATTVETEFVELWKWLVFGYQMWLEFDRILTVPLAGSIRVIQVFHGVPFVPFVPFVPPQFPAQELVEPQGAMKKPKWSASK